MKQNFNIRTVTMADLFDEKAKDWDVNEMVRDLSTAVSSAIVKQVPLYEWMCVMDFGAGTGLISSQIGPLVNKIVAVDISKAMLEQLASKSELQGKVEIACQNILDVPLERTFDLIMSAMALHHVKDTEGLIQCFANHMDSGALLALVDLDKEDGTFHPEDIAGVFHNGFEREDLQNLLEKYGFEKVHFVTAHKINKEGKTFPVFLLTAKKK